MPKKRRRHAEEAEKEPQERGRATQAKVVKMGTFYRGRVTNFESFYRGMVRNS